MPTIRQTGIGDLEGTAYIEKGSLIETSKAINTDYFAANISPTKTPATHRIYIRLATTSVVKIEMDDGATTDVELKLNDGVALDANDLYSFDVVLLTGQSYNIQHETGTQNVFCTVVELPPTTG